MGFMAGQAHASGILHSSGPPVTSKLTWWTASCQQSPKGRLSKCHHHHRLILWYFERKKLHSMSKLDHEMEFAIFENEGKTPLSILSVWRTEFLLSSRRIPKSELAIDIIQQTSRKCKCTVTRRIAQPSKHQMNPISDNVSRNTKSTVRRARSSPSGESRFSRSQVLVISGLSCPPATGYGWAIEIIGSETFA